MNYVLSKELPICKADFTMRRRRQSSRFFSQSNDYKLYVTTDYGRYSNKLVKFSLVPLRIATSKRLRMATQITIH